jgi:hypothetical protein
MKSSKSINQWYRRFNENGIITNGEWFMWDVKKLTQGFMRDSKKCDYAAISVGLLAVVIVIAGIISVLVGC